MFRGTLVFSVLSSLLVTSGAVADPPTDEGIGPPTRTKPLPSGHFFTATNHHGGAVDLVIKRQNDNGDWTNRTANGQPNGHCNSGLVDCDVYGTYLSYGLPLYAPVDGVVANCWRNHPNAPEADKPHPKRCCGGGELRDNVTGKCLLGACDGNCQKKLDDCPSDICGANPPNQCRITRSGNHITIHTHDDHTVLLGHLAPGSIPKRFCPHDDKFMDDSRVKSCNGCGAPAESAIPMDERPTVRRGEFIGRLGSSGASGGPHVHVGVNAVTVQPGGALKKKEAVPYRIKNAWIRPRNDASAWRKFDGEIVPVPSDHQVIHPTPFLRKDSQEGEPVSDVAVTNSSITVAHLPDGRLELTTWDVDADGNVAMQDQAVTEGSASRFDMARPGSSGRGVVTALKAENGELQLDHWRVASDGSITRGDKDTSSGAVGPFALTRVPKGRGVVSAVKTGSGSLKLTVWNVDDQDQLVRRGSVQGDPIRAIAVTTIRDGRHAAQPEADRFKGVVSAAKRENGVLQVASWRYDHDQKDLSAADSLDVGPIQGQLAVTAVKVGSNREMIVVAGRGSSSTRLMSFAVSTDGSLTKKWETDLSDSTDIDLNEVSLGRFTVSLKNEATGSFRVIGFALEPKGKLIRLGDEWGRGNAGQAASAVLSRRGGDTLLVLVAVRAANGRLKIISYDTNL